MNLKQIKIFRQNQNFIKAGVIMQNLQDDDNFQHNLLVKYENKDQDKERYIWQKNHLENKTGSKDSHKPVKINKKNTNLKKYETWK